MKKSLLVLVGLVLISGIIWTNLASKENDNTFIIKTLVPLTGQSASVAESVKEGITLAEDTLKLKYGDKFKIQLLDSGSDPATAISIYRQQIENKGDNQAILYTLSPIGKAITPLLDGKIFTFALAAVDGLAKPEKNIFQLSPKSIDIKQALERFIKKQKIKTISIVYPENDYGLENLKIVKGSIENCNGQVLNEIPYSATDFDFKIQAMKVVKSSPDMIFVIGVGNTYLNVLRDINSQEYKGILMSDWSFAIPYFYTAYPKLTNKVYFITPIPPKSFVEAYEKKYPGKAAWMLESGVFYDSILLTAEACSKTNCSADEMGKYISKITNYDGATGRFSFTPNGDITVDTQVSKIENGKIIPVE